MRVIRYEATPANVKYVYGVAEPVAHVRPGDTLAVRVLDLEVDGTQGVGANGAAISIRRGRCPANYVVVAIIDKRFLPPKMK